MKSPEEINAAESVLHFIRDNYKGSIVMEEGLLTSEETTFQPGERVRVKETRGRVVENLWGISSQHMMVEVQFPNGATNIYAENELEKEEAEPSISIDLDDLSSVFADSINALSNECHSIAADHGFWDGAYVDPIQFKLARMALIHSEVSEAVEAIRKDDDQVIEELADICIRVFDYCGGYNLDLGSAILSKMETNRNRPHMHGKRA